MAASQGTAAESGLRVVADVACPACGCVCDDLRITVDGARVVRVEPGCRLAEAWFPAHSNVTRPEAEIDGRRAAPDEAMARAAEILRGADNPLIYGLSRSSTDGQRAAVELADLLGATIDTTASLCHGPSIMGLQGAGESTCTLGEIRNRADLVIFWGCNPAVSHPRHAERYSVFPVGEFVPDGRAGRKVVMVGNRDQVHQWRLNAAGATPDYVVAIEPGGDFEAIAALRGMIRFGADAWRAAAKREPMPAASATGGRLGPDCGADFLQLRELAEMMRACRCGVIFFGIGLTGTSGDETAQRTPLGHLNVECLLKLVAEMNSITRFHARRMRLHGDVSGADTVLCWQTGYPFSVDLSRGYPRYNPGEFSADDLLARGEPDAVLIVGSEKVLQFRPESLAALRRTPCIVIDYPGTDPPVQPAVRFTTSPYGLRAAGTAYRMDEVPIRYRAALPATYPTDAEVIQRLQTELHRSVKIGKIIKL
jgi:formylmethanofuran dehydrogenase subunit B